MYPGVFEQASYSYAEASACEASRVLASREIKRCADARRTTAELRVPAKRQAEEEPASAKRAGSRGVNVGARKR